MKKYAIQLSLFNLLLLIISCSGIQNSKITQKHIECTVSIIGGGPAGVYLAYKLAPKYRDQLCLFEKESKLGGRMTDETLSGNETSSDIFVGTGARRVNDVQILVKNLAKELDIELQTPEKRSQLIHTKKRSGYSPDNFVQDFPKLIGPLDKDPNTTREDEIYTLLLNHKAEAKKYPNLKSYIKAIAGNAAVEYLRTASRFHGDFDYDLSADNYLETLSEEFQLSSENLYPIGGMSAFIRAMEKKIKTSNVRIYKSEALLEFQEINSNFQLTTQNHEVKTKKLILAIPPSGLDHISGELAAEIRNKKEYKALIGIPIVVINQWWNSAWWKNIPANPNAPGNTGQVWRAWSNAQCVNHVEIPQEAYAAAGLVTRSVYTDDLNCVKYWSELLKEKGVSAVERELSKQLKNLFFNSKNASIPQPLKTSFHYWPAGWYYIRAGSKVSNDDIVKWAKEPIPGKSNLMLVGESYWPNRPGWSVGAYNSANELLKEKF